MTESAETEQVAKPSWNPVRDAHNTYRRAGDALMMAVERYHAALRAIRGFARDAADRELQNIEDQKAKGRTWLLSSENGVVKSPEWVNLEYEAKELRLLVVEADYRYVRARDAYLIALGVFQRPDEAVGVNSYHGDDE